MANTTYNNAPLSQDDTLTLSLQDHESLTETIHQAIQTRYSSSLKSLNTTTKVPAGRSTRRAKTRSASRRLKQRLAILQSRASLESEEVLSGSSYYEEDDSGNFSDADSIDLSKERLSHKEQEEWGATVHAMGKKLTCMSLRLQAVSPSMCQTRPPAMAA